MNKLLGLGLILSIIFNPLFAQDIQERKFIVSKAPASPYPFDYQQKDGRTVAIQMSGDGDVHQDYTIDGYTVLSIDSQYEYAILDENNQLIASGIPAANPNERTKKEEKFLSGITKKLRFHRDQVLFRKTSSQEKTMSVGNTAAFPSKGKNKMLIILIDFPNMPAKYSKEDFERLANEEGYNGTGSIRDYYLQNSYGQLELEIDVVGWFTAKWKYEYYGSNTIRDNDANPGGLVKEAIEYAEKAGIDFSQYDNNGDGWVDGIQIIHAGGGEEAGAGENTIWSHSSVIPALSFDNVGLKAYTMNPEIYNKTGGITTIGVLCHEFGHNLGLPDYYDTDYSSIGLGKWDMMAGGSWLDNGATPAYHNAWSKLYLGWLTPEIIDFKGTYTLNDPANENKAYIIPINNKTEYYLLENRQQQNFDAFLPGSGLLVFHIDEEVMEDRINYNMVNDDETHPAIRIIPCDNDFSSSSFSGDIYPNKSGNNLISSFSTPALETWSIGLSKNQITHIQHDTIERTIHFNYNTNLSNALAYFTINKEDAMITEQVNFFDQSANSPTNWKWIFEDANNDTITTQIPDDIHFTEIGLKSATLIVSNEFGSDTMTRYIDITPDYPLIAGGEFTLCSGYFYDSGLLTKSYNKNENAITTLYPGSEDKYLKLSFNLFSLESSEDCANDYLLVYDGKDTLAPLIGRYCGTNKPKTIKASNPSGALTFHFVSNNDITLAGWKAIVECTDLDTTNSITDQKTAGIFKFYPNPANNEITIDHQTNDQHEIAIYNMTGSMVYNEKTISKTSKINISNLPKGLYFIKIQDGASIHTEKMIKL